MSADVIITTGGTGITSRDSTYEAIVALFDKRLDGFGELFRMLSYQQIGAAAMLAARAPARSRTHGDLRAAGLGARRAAGHGETDPARRSATSSASSRR